jgi:hypothetical protein
MRVSKILIALSVLVLASGTSIAGDSEGWFDMVNCAMCKNLTTHEGMLDNLGWDHHLTANGMMTVTVVPEAQATAWSETRAAMMATSEKLMAGEQMHLCNFCQSFGGLLMSGKANMEEFTTIGGEVSLVTSNDPATIKSIHAHAKRTMHEMEIMMKHAEGESR